MITGLKYLITLRLLNIWRKLITLAQSLITRRIKETNRNGQTSKLVSRTPMLLQSFLTVEGKKMSFIVIQVNSNNSWKLVKLFTIWRQSLRKFNLQLQQTKASMLKWNQSYSLQRLFIKAGAVAMALLPSSKNIQAFKKIKKL